LILAAPIWCAYLYSIGDCRKEYPTNGEQYAGQEDLRLVASEAAALGIPTAGFMACLAYFDGLRSLRLAANLIQAERDYFGSHTYERVDRQGFFHKEWNEG